MMLGGRHGGRTHRVCCHQSRREERENRTIVVVVVAHLMTGQSRASWGGDKESSVLPLQAWRVMQKQQMALVARAGSAVVLLISSLVAGSTGTHQKAAKKWSKQASRPKKAWDPGPKTQWKEPEVQCTSRLC